MAYGLYVTSGNSTLQIDSSKSYSYLKVTAAGTGTSVTRSANELLFVRPSAATARPVGANQSGTTYTFYDQLYNSVSLNYLKIQAVRAASASTGYGLQVYNVDGQLAFDSGVFTSGTAGENVAQIDFIRPAEAPYISGNYTNSASIVYTGSNYLSIYMNITNSYFTATPNTRLAGYHWNSADTTIRYGSYIAGPFGSIVVPTGEDIIGVIKI